MDSHYLNRILDLVLDPRAPYNLILSIMRTRKLRRMMNEGQPHRSDQLLVAVTFDVEREYGSYTVKGKCVTASQFLSSLDAFDDITVFVEGGLVEENSRTLRSLQQRGVEIGLHGYRHELWGRSQWYLPDRPLTPERKRALLEAGMEAFRKAGLREPVIFRSPNLVVDKWTLCLLAEKGFHVDSSLPSHRGVLPIPQFYNGPGGLVSVPVTADPTPSLSRRGVLPYCAYRACNLKTLRQMKEEELLGYVSRVVALQETLGCLPHIVILCHSWEFFNPVIGNRDYGYCCPANFEFLRNLSNFVSKEFGVRQVSMSTLANLFREKNDLPSFGR